MVPKKNFGIFSMQIFADLPSLFGFYRENSFFSTVEDRFEVRPQGIRLPCDMLSAFSASRE